MELSSLEIELTPSTSDVSYIGERRFKETSRFAGDPDATSAESNEVPLIPRHARKKLLIFGVDRDSGSSNPRALRDPRSRPETVASAWPQHEQVGPSNQEGDTHRRGCPR